MMLNATVIFWGASYFSTLGINFSVMISPCDQGPTECFVISVHIHAKIESENLKFVFSAIISHSRRMLLFRCFLSASPARRCAGL